MFNEKYDAEYKNLSETARVAATLRFLKGVTIWREGLRKKKTKAPHYLPPANLKATEIQTLHEGVMQRFFKFYNETTTAPENRDLRAAKRLGNYTPYMELLERFGC